MNNFTPQSNAFQTPFYINYPMTPTSSVVQRSPQNSALRYKNFAKQSNENLKVVSSQNQPPMIMRNSIPHFNFNSNFDTPIVYRTTSTHIACNLGWREDKTKGFLSPTFSEKNP